MFRAKMGGSSKPNELFQKKKREKTELFIRVQNSIVGQRVKE